MNTSKPLESSTANALAKVSGGAFKCTDPGGVAPCEIGNPNPQAEIPNGG